MYIRKVVGERVMLVAHISDLHIGDTTKNGTQNLQKMVDVLNNFEVDFDCVIVTGDIVHGNSKQDYKTAFELLNLLKYPYFVITGNKDGTQNLQNALELYRPLHPRGEEKIGLQYEVNDFEVKILALDTYKQGVMNGEMSAEKLAWLEQRLKENNSQKPVMILVHQFPFDWRSHTFDNRKPSWYEDFKRIVNQYKTSIKLVACGHLHNPVTGNINGVPVVVAPSVNWRAKYDFQKVEDIVADKKSLGFYVHQIDDENVVSCLVTFPL